MTYSAFTETGATQTIKTNQKAELILSCAYGFKSNYTLNSVYFRSLVDLENKSCIRAPLVITLPECELNQLSRRSKEALQMVCEQFRFP